MNNSINNLKVRNSVKTMEKFESATNKRNKILSFISLLFDDDWEWIQILCLKEKIKSESERGLPVAIAHTWTFYRCDEVRVFLNRTLPTILIFNSFFSFSFVVLNSIYIFTIPDNFWKCFEGWKYFIISNFINSKN